MDRKYKTKKSRLVTFFTGTEVEKTKAFGMKTLFVVGLQDLDKIVGHADALDIKHIYLGANHSCLPASITEWEAWEDLVLNLLNAENNDGTSKYLVTLDVENVDTVNLKEMGACEHDNFIPMIRVVMQNVGDMGANAIIKIDDLTMNWSNNGVWCHNVDKFLTTDTMTGWDQYETDEVLEELGSVPIKEEM